MKNRIKINNLTSFININNYIKNKYNLSYK